jgi:hypothetical protein
MRATKAALIGVAEPFTKSTHGVKIPSRLPQEFTNLNEPVEMAMAA